jgi:exo-1,4-beta-D-glucosaminidase
MPKVEFKVSAAGRIRAMVENPLRTTAFVTRLRAPDRPGGEESLPLLWQDNYIALLPGERREIAATHQGGGAAKPTVEADGWNVTPRAYPVR